VTALPVAGVAAVAPGPEPVRARSPARPAGTRRVAAGAVDAQVAGIVRTACVPAGMRGNVVHRF